MRGNCFYRVKDWPTPSPAMCQLMFSCAWECLRIGARAGPNSATRVKDWPTPSTALCRFMFVCAWECVCGYAHVQGEFFYQGKRLAYTTTRAVSVDVFPRVGVVAGWRTCGFQFCYQGKRVAYTITRIGSVHVYLRVEVRLRVGACAWSSSATRVNKWHTPSHCVGSCFPARGSALAGTCTCGRALLAG